MLLILIFISYYDKPKQIPNDIFGFAWCGHNNMYFDENCRICSSFFDSLIFNLYTLRSSQRFGSLFGSGFDVFFFLFKFSFVALAHKRCFSNKHIYFEATSNTFSIEIEKSQRSPSDYNFIKRDNNSRNDETMNPNKIAIKDIWNQPNFFFLLFHSNEVNHTCTAQ